jgi:hypothetical protein
LTPQREPHLDLLGHDPEDGRIVEHGSHDLLLAAGGRYADRVGKISC